MFGKKPKRSKEKNRGLVLKHKRVRITLKRTSDSKKPAKTEKKEKKQKTSPRFGFFRVFGGKHKDAKRKGQKQKKKEKPKTEKEQLKPFQPGAKPAKTEEEKKKSGKTGGFLHFLKPKTHVERKEEKGKQRRKEAGEKTRKPEKLKKPERGKDGLDKSKKSGTQISPASNQSQAVKSVEIPIVYRKPSSGITTEIDDMLQLVSEKKKVKVNVLAKRFSVSEERIQEWAGILEDQGLVRMHYPAIGKPEVRIGTEKNEEKKEEEA